MRPTLAIDAYDAAVPQVYAVHVIRRVETRKSLDKHTHAHIETHTPLKIQRQLNVLSPVYITECPQDWQIPPMS